jgi:hypothetical protein
MTSITRWVPHTAVPNAGRNICAGCIGTYTTSGITTIEQRCWTGLVGIRISSRQHSGRIPAGRCRPSGLLRAQLAPEAHPPSAEKLRPYGPEETGESRGRLWRPLAGSCRGVPCNPLLLFVKNSYLRGSTRTLSRHSERSEEPRRRPFASLRVTEHPNR